MKKYLRLILLTVLIGFNTVSFAQFLKIESFKANPEDNDAQLIGWKDKNKQPCAIIKIMTDLKGLTFEPVGSFIPPVVDMSGEYWLYVPKGEKQIKIVKEGFTTLAVNYSDYDIDIESSKVYVMELKSDNTPQDSSITRVPKGDFTISTKPAGATITMENEPFFKGLSPLTIRRHATGVFKIKIEKEFYNTVDTVIQIVSETASTLMVPLVQNVGFIKFRVNPPSPSSNIYLDGKLIQGLDEAKPFPISPGIHKLEINSKNFTTETRNLLVAEGKTDSVFVDLKPISGRITITISPSNTAKAEVWINDQKTEYLAPCQFPFQTGDNTLSLKLKGYPVYSKSFSLNKDENLKLHFNMRSFDDLKHQIRTRQMREKIWAASAIGTSAAALYLIMDSNKKNQAYKTAVGSDANTLHTQIDSGRKTAAALLGVAILSSVEFSIQIFKKANEKRRLTLGSDGKSVGLKAGF